jgi:phosphoglycolate phosphatase
MYSLIIFDWDGTLSDSTGRIVDSMLTAGRECGLPVITPLAAQDIIGLGLPEAVEVLWPGITAENSKKVRLSYSENFVSGSLVPMDLFEGAEELLLSLQSKGISLAVATGKSRRGLDRVLLSTGIAHYFHATRCADETRSKPDPLMLNQIMQQLSIEPKQVLMVGDTTYDLDMANNAGIDHVGLTHGAHMEDRLLACKPQAILHNLHELNQWLQHKEQTVG